ncbi:hypothetical protein FBY04_11164 [Pseudomonas sp. SJZ080]|nr:hypothetical protein FBY04_11164 [Pseudomonas sp. SJZ080]
MGLRCIGVARGVKRLRGARLGLGGGEFKGGAVWEGLPEGGQVEMCCLVGPLREQAHSHI